MLWNTVYAKNALDSVVSTISLAVDAAPVPDVAAVPVAAMCCHS